MWPTILYLLLTIPIISPIIRSCFTHNTVLYGPHSCIVRLVVLCCCTLSRVYSTLSRRHSTLSRVHCSLPRVHCPLPKKMYHIPLGTFTYWYIFLYTHYTMARVQCKLYMVLVMNFSLHFQPQEGNIMVHRTVKISMPAKDS